VGCWLGAEIIGAHIQAFANLIQWYSSFGGQIGFKGDEFEIGAVTVTISVASQVGDDTFRSRLSLVCRKAGSSPPLRAGSE
jgi:hypothetical protein